MSSYFNRDPLAWAQHKDPDLVEMVAEARDDPARSGVAANIAYGIETMQWMTSFALSKGITVEHANAAKLCAEKLQAMRGFLVYLYRNEPLSTLDEKTVQQLTTFLDSYPSLETLTQFYSTALKPGGLERCAVLFECYGVLATDAGTSEDACNEMAAHFRALARYKK